MSVLGPKELNRALLARQLLLRRQQMPVPDALEHLVGLQAQAPDAPYVALWSRLEDFAADQLAALLLERRAVRIPLMRATLHLVSTADCLALRPVVQPALRRTFAASPFARNLDGVDLDEVAARGRALLAQPRTRAALGRALGEHWPNQDPLSLAYAVTHLVPAVQVPPRGIWGERGQATWAAAETWIGQALERPAEAMTVAQRYLAAFGPASAQDFALWSGLADAQRLLESLRPRLQRFRDQQGRELLDLEGAPRPDADTPAPPKFLPEYDNVLLSHRDRSRIIEDNRRVPLPPGTGAAAGTVLIDGFVRATWKIERTVARAVLVVTPHAPLPRHEANAVNDEGERLLAFLAAETAEADVVLAAPA